MATRRPPKVRRKEADLFVEDETESFRDALRSGQTQKVTEMLKEVEETWLWMGQAVFTKPIWVVL